MAPCCYLQAVAATEKAQRAQHGAQHAPHGAQHAQHMRLTVVQRENEASLTKCLCRAEADWGLDTAGVAIGGAAALAQLVGSSGFVVALFQSRTAREVDLVPGSVVLVRAGAWRRLPEPDGGAGGGPPVMLCHTAVQG
jgi:hypothetical protein